MPLPVRNIFFSFKLHCDYSSLLKLIKWGGFFENRIQVQREQKKIRSLPCPTENIAWFDDQSLRKVPTVFWQTI